MSKQEISHQELRNLVEDAKAATVSTALAHFVALSREEQLKAFQSVHGYKTSMREWFVDEFLPKIRLMPCPMTHARCVIDVTDVFPEMEQLDQHDDS